MAEAGDRGDACERHRTGPVAKREPKKVAPAKTSESSSIRVAVEKVDQLINPVGELVITQSMLAQRSGALTRSPTAIC